MVSYSSHCWLELNLNKLKLVLHSIRLLNILVKHSDLILQGRAFLRTRVMEYLQVLTIAMLAN